MNELRTLLALELRSLYGINKFLYSKDPKERGRYLGLGAVWAVLLVMVFTYVGGLVYGLCALGLASIVPAYLTVLASLLILAFGLFTAGNRIFGQRGYELLASMPLKARNLVFSRFLSLYAEDLLLSAAIMLPGVVAYGLCVKPHPRFYVAAVMGALIIPAIPLVISTLLGTLILAISSRMKHKSLVQTALILLLVLGTLSSSFLMDPAPMLSPEALGDLAVLLSGVFETLYPPALWLNEAMVRGSLADLGLFLLVSAVFLGFAMVLVSRCFHRVLQRLQTTAARHDYRMGKLESHSLLKALYLREAKRYFSSSIYVTNTIMGPIMGAVMAVALWCTGLDRIQAPFPFAIGPVLPYLFSAVFCMMTTTSTAISMEGKQVWVIQSLPVPVKTWLDSKILLNLSLMLPFYLISVAALVAATKATALEGFWLAAIPCVLCLFATVAGISVNLRSHRFDWEKEETVVKQSFSAMAGGFAGFLLAAILGFGTLAVPAQYGLLFKTASSLLVLALTGLLYRKNNRTVLSQL